jgi:hypothetical protein
MKWLVHKTKSLQNELLYAIQELGHQLKLIEYVPFSEIDPNLPENEPIVFQGAISWALNHFKNKLPIKPFVWFDPDKLSCKCYYAHWHPFIVQKIFGFYPLGMLRSKQDWLFDVYGHPKYNERELQIFIRPDTNDKLFSGEIVAKGRFDSWLNWVWIEENLAESLVIVSRPETLLKEYRLIVCDNKVITGSRYMVNGTLDTDVYFPDEAARITEEACKAWTPHPIFVMDVAETPEGFFIVECGSINCAGFYKADMRIIVKAMSEMAERCFYDKE